MARIFLCHANEDKPKVEALYDHLRALGFEPWMDKKDLIPGQNWEYEIPRVLRESAFVLICLSQHIERRGYLQREFKLVVDVLKEIPGGMIHTIPVRLEPCSIPEQFRTLHWCNLFESDGYEKLEQAIRYGFEQRGLTVPETSAPPPEPTVAPERFTNDLGMTFVRIPAGEFSMGSSDSDSQADDDEKPQHPVTIREPFYLGIHPVTQAQWETLMHNNPSEFEGDPTHPVERVTWPEAQQFLDRLRATDDRHRYALPSEAQWEYACRAGSTGAHCFDPDRAKLDAYAWYRENSDRTTHPVGRKLPNPWGLYDMHGNVWEWVQDWYGDYPADAMTDPGGPAIGTYRIIRGGSWKNSVRGTRSANRRWLHPGVRNDHLGFRCVSLATP